MVIRFRKWRHKDTWVLYLITNCSVNKINREIADKISQAKYFSIMADEVTLGVGGCLHALGGK